MLEQGLEKVRRQVEKNEAIQRRNNLKFFGFNPKMGRIFDTEHTEKLLLDLFKVYSYFSPYKFLISITLTLTQAFIK